jgi:hypothetical protein
VPLFCWNVLKLKSANAEVPLWLFPIISLLRPRDDPDRRQTTDVNQVMERWFGCDENDLQRY